MQTHIYATFIDAKSAEKAAGALLDIGVEAQDLTVIQHHNEVATGTTYNVINTPATTPAYAGEVPAVSVVETREFDTKDETEAEDAAKHGISTTTAGDAGIGAAKGAGWGVGVGAIAAIASLFVPGVGLVVGGGALAMAIGAAVATTGAGAVAGAVTGYLKEQGFDEHAAQKYEDIVTGGGALISVALPSGKVNEPEAWEVISKYNGLAFTRLDAVKAGY